jgi:F1F0 ATPase subunit 2
MNKTFIVMAAWAAGIVLGTIFFGGLLWTIRKGVTSSMPALWFMGSMILRMSVVMAGFYFVSAGHWERLLPCLTGFVMAQLIVTRLTQPAAAASQTHSTEEAHHAH